MRYQCCLVPADRIYVGDDQGAWLAAQDSKPMFLGGVWDMNTFALLKAESPAALIMRIGARAPIVIQATDYGTWLSPKVTDAGTIQAMIERRRQDWAETTRPAVC